MVTPATNSAAITNTSRRLIVIWFSPSFSLTDHPFTAQYFDVLLPVLIDAYFHQRNIRREHADQSSGCLMVRKQRRDQDQQRRRVLQTALGEVAVALKVPGFAMPLDRDPVVQRLKREIRIGRRFDFDYNQPP